ncbi:MAG: Na-K-Cl cotransporter [Rhodothermia bacterium]|nr:Na-K-Cl cotransporter [Rhodothermia bacterium]
MRDQQNQVTGLSTFGGVFTPSILTILGVIMYLRFGWVVGNVGLLKTMGIVTLSTGITLLTALSISAIATAQQVKIGGAYYMISRSLGIESGGAIGIPLYIAQALSVALYTIGFAESVVRVLPSLDEKLVGIVTTSFVALVAMKSARAAIRTQYIIMGAIGVSLLSLVAGGPVEPVVPPGEVVDPQPFWVVFAVFFPAVTGIMAGVNMSGDLRNPARSIPRGTLFAVGVGYLIYMLIPILLVNRASPAELVHDPLIMKRMAFWGDAIMLGVWGATLSSAVGSILGAPRVLQALARDGVLPRPFRFLGRGSGPEDEPRVGTAVTFAIAIVTVYLGNLNMIAPILTMFFLTTYGVLNVVAGIERFVRNPSYRPDFKVHWSVSLLGAVGCAAVMFLINPVATTAAIVVVISIYVWLERKELRSEWGDVRRGIWMTLARAGLMHIGETPDPKNWRPHFLVLSGAPTRRWHLVDLAASIGHNKALMTLATVVTSPSIDKVRIASMENTIREYVDRKGVRTLVRAVSAETPFEGAAALVDLYGLGGLVPNTVLLGASESPERRDEYCRMVRHFHESKRNTVIVHHNEEHGFGDRRSIDVWWGGLQGNGALMLILAYLLQTSLPWRGADLTVKMIAPSADAAGTAGRNLDRLVEATRTGATSEVIVSDGRPVDQIIRESSADTDIIFMGMAEPRPDFREYYDRLQERMKTLPSTVLVLSAEDLSFGDVLIEKVASGDDSK